MRTVKNQSGVTLIELIIALVVIGIALAGFAMVVTTNIQSRDQGFSHQRVLDARSCAESIISRFRNSGLQKSSCKVGELESASDLKCEDFALEVKKGNDENYCDVTILIKEGQDSDTVPQNIIIRLPIND